MINMDMSYWSSRVP